MAAMFAETIVLLTNSTPLASGTDDCAGWRTLTAKNMSGFEPVNRLDSTCTSWTGPAGPERGSTYTWAAPFERTPKCVRTIVHGPPPRIWMRSLWLSECVPASASCRSESLIVTSSAAPRMTSASRTSWKRT